MNDDAFNGDEFVCLLAGRDLQPIPATLDIAHYQEWCDYAHYHGHTFGYELHHVNGENVVFRRCKK